MPGFGEGLQNVLGGAQFVMDSVEQGRQRVRQQEADVMRREQFGMEKEQFGQQQEMARVKAAGFYAGMLLKAPPQMRAQLWESKIKPGLTAAGLPVDGPYSPEYDALAEQLWAATGGGKGEGPMNVSPGGEIVDPVTGRVIHANTNFAPPKPQYDASRGMFVTGPDSPQGPGAVQVAPARPDYEGARLQLAQQAAQAAAQARQLAERGNAPPGYRFDAAGNLERIPGAPQAIGKPLPAPVVNKLTKQAGIYDNTVGLSAGFKDQYAGNMVGGTVENFVGRLGLPGATEGQADWWQAYDRQKNEVRNQLFGSALTPSEAAAFERADINPNMAPARIRANLKTQQDIIARGLARQGKVWKAQGFNTEAIDAATMPSLPEVAEAPKPAAPANVPRARNPKTGEVIEFRNGQWVPAQ